MLRKKRIKKSDKVSVTFEVPGFDSARALNLAGEFNTWHPERTPMRLRKDGVWAVTVRLPGNRCYQSRIVVDGARWMADERADELVPNGLGGQNSVVVLG